MSGPNYLEIQSGTLGPSRWPNPFPDDADMAWRIWQHKPNASDLAWMRSVVEAYTHLCVLSQRERNRRIELIKAEAARIGADVDEVAS